MPPAPPRPSHAPGTKTALPRQSSRIARLLLLGLVAAGAIWLTAPRAEAACDPDSPPLVDGGSVTCTGTDETGFDGSAANDITITTSGTVEIDDSSAAAGAIVVGNGVTAPGNQVTIGADATVNVVDTNGVGVLAGDDNTVTNAGTINVTVSNGAGIRVGSNTDPSATPPAPVSVTNDGAIVLTGDDAVGIDSNLNYDITNSATGSITIAGDRGIGIRGVDDAFVVNSGTIVIDGDDGRAIQIGNNANNILSNGAISQGNVTINGANGIIIEIGDNAGSVLGGTNILAGANSRGLSVGNRTDPMAQANHTLQGTLEIDGDGAIGAVFGDGWFSDNGTSLVPDLRNQGTLNVRGVGAIGIRAGDDALGTFDNSLVANDSAGAINVTGTDAIGISLGANDFLDPMDATVDDVFTLDNRGSITGGADAGPLVEFRTSLGSFENRIRNNFGASINADRTNAGMANRGIAILGTAGIERIENTGTITGDLMLGDGDNVFLNEAIGSFGFAGTLNGDYLGGVGADSVTNFGTITGDLALGDGDNFYVHELNAQHTGVVQGGSGADTITNRGFLSSDLELGDGDNVVSNESGAASTGMITTGTGADTVTNAGAFVSNANLGGGDDTFRTEPTAAISTETVIDGEGGSDTIIAGFAATDLRTALDLSRFSNFENLLIEGDATAAIGDAATWVLGNADSYSGGLEIGRAARVELASPLALGGDLEIADAATLVVAVERTGPAITVAGTATLDGVIDIDPVDLGEDGTFAVIDATGGRGGTEFDTIEIPSSLGLMTFSTAYTPTGLEVIAVRSNAFADPAIAFGANHLAIAGYLDAVQLDGGGDEAVRTTLSDLATATGTLDNVFSALDPQIYDAQTAVVAESGRRVARALLDRPRECTPGKLDPWQGTRTPVHCHAHRWAPWVTGVGSFRARDSHAGRPEYDALMGGLVFGIDAPTIAGVELTLAVSSQSGTLDTAGRGHANLTSGGLAGRAAWARGPLRIQSVFSWAHTRHESSRAIFYSEGSRASRAEVGEDSFDSQRFLVAGEVGFEFELGPVSVEPIAAIDWIRVETDGITEDGAGSLDTAIESRDDDLLTSRVGVRFGTVYEERRYLHRYLEWTTGVWRPSVDLRWRQTWSGNDRDVTARLADGPTTVAPFTVGAREDAGGLEVGVGVSFVPKYADRLQFDLRYDAYRAAHTVDHDLFAQVRIGF